MEGTEAKKYQKKNLHEHVLTRPEIYIGSTSPQEEKTFVYKSNKITLETLKYTPGFIKIFDEILVNAIDHSMRESSVNTIKIVVQEDHISVFNNGKGIPVVIHPEYNIYIPELIFGNLLTSTNYDDTVERVTGGVNGLGSNCTNIFSKRFIVETCDGNFEYKQEFKDNMKVKKPPKIKETKKEQYTKITFYPDFEKFGMQSIDADSASLIYKRVYDTVVCTNKGMSVFLDGKKLVSKFKDYLKFYDGVFNSLEIKDKHSWDIAVSQSNDGFKQVSFVNGISTIHGGKHVDYVVNQLIKKLTVMISAKKKVENIKPQFIKDNLFVVVRSTVINPKFSSQSKENLTTPSKDFGVSFDIPEDFIIKVYKSIVDSVTELTRFKNKKNLDKDIPNSRKSTLIIPNLDDAIYAGTSKSKKCSLMLTEGLSAKTFAISGLSVIGREYYGAFPLKGKLLNVREATANQLINNEEILNIKKIMGLQNSKTYETDEEFATLRYSSIIILTDADSDGKHIASLLVNMIHYFWPCLMKRTGFIKRIQTPIVKVSKSKKTIEFYSDAEYKNWSKTNSGWDVKYYKGLGTSTSSEAKEIFRKLEMNTITYLYDENTNYFIELAFDKKNADKRKDWLKVYDPEVEYVPKNTVSFSDSIDKELIHFSAYDNVRSIPNIMDGLKPSQRKVLYTMFKRNQIKEIKVAQLGAAVAEMTTYHHGEVSLYGTIVGMAQNYIGSNNINLLVPKGQFGTRYAAGKDAASPRYIFTQLSEITSRIYVPDDSPILEYMVEDSHKIEPKFYVATVPMVLVNGTIGIGTGYSTNIPNYNIDDIVKNMKLHLSGKPLEDLIPYYSGFKGTITVEEEGSFTTRGVFKLQGNGIVITELPINTWTEAYKDFLNIHFQDVNCEIVNNSSDVEVEFKIIFKQKSEFEKHNKNILKDLKLTSRINTSNFHLFDHDMKLRKYSGPNDIIASFTDQKIKYMKKRKDYLVERNERDLELLKNKSRFLQEIMDDVLVVYKKKKKEIEEILLENKYAKIDGNFQYLTGMNISSFNQENLDALCKKIQDTKQTLESIVGTSIKQMILNDLVSLKI
jgi:DNA topoisomerase-2